MTQPNVKTGHFMTPLKNLTRIMTLYTRLADRHMSLPGIGVFYGPSGLGKTHAAVYLQNKTRGLRIEIGQTWTTKTLLVNILREMNVAEARGTIPQLAEDVKLRLADNPRRPLLIDEADLLITKRMIEVVREIYEAAQCPVVLIGEEALPQKLATVERAHNRVLEWVAAEPCDMADARELARTVAPGLAIDDALLARVLKESRGVARRVAVNLARLSEWAREQGQAAVNEAAYSGGFYTGVAPTRRAG